MTVEGKRFSRRFAVVCWTIAAIIVFFPPAWLIAIPTAAIWGWIKISDNRRARQVQPTLFAPEQLRNVPVELRGGRY